MSSILLKERVDQLFDFEDYLCDLSRQGKDFFICDPHFHLWDMSKMYNPRLGLKVKHSNSSNFSDSITLKATSASLFDDNQNCISSPQFEGGLYSASEYLHEIENRNSYETEKKLPLLLKMCSCIHVEAIVGQPNLSDKDDVVKREKDKTEKPQIIQAGEEADYIVLDPVQETKYVIEQYQEKFVSKQISLGLVVYVDLSASEEKVKEQINSHLQTVEEAAVNSTGNDKIELLQMPKFKVVGIRDIMNYDKNDSSLCWPHKVRDYTLLSSSLDFQIEPCAAKTTTNEEFIERNDQEISEDMAYINSFQQNLKTIESFGLVFDMQVNWNQLERAAALVKQYPNLTVVLNHFGLLKLYPLSKLSGEAIDNEQKQLITQENNEKINVWKRGMKQFAELILQDFQIYIKVSMLDYILQSPKWYLDHEEGNGDRQNKDCKSKTTPTFINEDFKLIKELFDFVYDLIGPERLMFASNYPVSKPFFMNSESNTNEKKDGNFNISLDSLENLYINGFLQLCKDKIQCREESEMIFRTNALKAYGLND